MQSDFYKKQNLTDIYTFASKNDPEMVLHFKKWMQIKKKTSFQISEMDEKCKVEYFSRQQKLIDTL